MQEMKWNDPHFARVLDDGTEAKLTPARAMEVMAKEISELQRALNDLLVASDHCTPNEGEWRVAHEALCQSMGCPTAFEGESRDVCRQCGNPIVCVGTVWKHEGKDYRHIATPTQGCKMIVLPDAVAINAADAKPLPHSDNPSIRLAPYTLMGMPVVISDRMCANCGGEMKDSPTGVVMDCLPEQVGTKCVKCGRHGTRSVED